MTSTAVEVDLARSALDMARVFTRGGRLAIAAPGRKDHARHVAVEFVHPAITGARSLPAFAADPDDLRHCVSPTDALMIIESDQHAFNQPVPAAALVLMVGRGRSGPELVRWYHVLWELVQLCLEHPGLVGGTASAGGDSTNFLYPFLDASEDDEQALLTAMTSSAAAKDLQSRSLGADTVAANQAVINAIATDVVACNASGGTVFAIGNGGSSCDAGRLVRRLRGCGIRAASFADDGAILTALANDLGAAHIFSRQVEAALLPNDVLVAFSTSGASANLLAAFDCQVSSQATVVACAGYGGGALASHRNVDHRAVVESTSVHRIQEAQGVIIDKICEHVQRLGGTP